MISAKFRAHPDAATITSIDGIGNLLGAGSSPPLAAAWQASPRRTTSLGTPDSRRHAAIQAAAPATFTGPSDTTGSCNGCSTPRR